MSLKQSFNDFWASTGARMRKYTGQSSKRMVTQRFVEKTEDGGNVLHWLEAVKWSEPIPSKDPLYKIFQRAVSADTSKGNTIKETHEVTLDDNKFFSKEDAIKMLEDWEEEAKRASNEVTLDNDQPLLPLHFSRHKTP